MRQERYLYEVDRLAKVALIQANVVTPCARHDGVLLHNCDSQAEHIAYGLASTWLKQEVGTFIREDLRDAIKGVLDRAVNDGCPECARQGGG